MLVVRGAYILFLVVFCFFKIQSCCIFLFCAATTCMPVVLDVQKWHLFAQFATAAVFPLDF